MDGSASIGLEQALLGHSLGFAPFASPTQVYVSLCLASTVPSETVRGLEASGGGYARQPATFALIAGPSNIAANTASIEFPQALSSWGQIGFFELWDAPSGGNRLYWGQLVDTADFTTPLVLQVSAGDITRFSAGTLGVQASTGAGGTASVGAYLPLAGGALTGPLLLSQDPLALNEAATKSYVDAHSGSGGGPGFLPLSGGTMLGALTLAGGGGTLSAPLTSSAAISANLNAFDMTTTSAPGWVYAMGAQVGGITGTLPIAQNYGVVSFRNKGYDTVHSPYGGGVTMLAADFLTGGSGATGNRAAIQGVMTINAGTGNKAAGYTDGFYGGAGFTMEMQANDGGTDFTANGCYGHAFGFNPVVIAYSGATNLYEVTGSEFNIACRTGSSTRTKGMLNFVQLSFDAVQAAAPDADGVSTIANPPGAVGWRDYGYAFGTPYHQWAFNASAALIKVYQDQGGGTMPARWGVDMHHATFPATGNAYDGGFWRTKGASLDGAGMLRLGTTYLTPGTTGLAIDAKGSVGASATVTTGGVNWVTGQFASDPYGGFWRITAVGVGPATAVAMVIPPTCPTTSPPANPIALTAYGTAAVDSSATGLTINITWNTTATALSLQPSGGPTTSGGSITVGTASASYVQISGGAGNPNINPAGAATAIGLNVKGKGTGGVNLQSGNGTIIFVQDDGTGAIGNALTVLGGLAANPIRVNSNSPAGINFNGPIQNNRTNVARAGLWNDAATNYMGLRFQSNWLGYALDAGSWPLNLLTSRDSVKATAGAVNLQQLNTYDAGHSGPRTGVWSSSNTIGAPYIPQPWQANHAYVLGDLVTNGGLAAPAFGNLQNVYQCIVAGSSAASGGPTGGGSSIVDGTATWAYGRPFPTQMYYVGGVFAMAAGYNCGGTAPTSSLTAGSVFGGNMSGRLNTGATNFNQCVGLEIDNMIAAGASASVNVGLQIAHVETHAVPGTEVDVCLRLADQGVPGEGWRNLVNMGDYASQWPVDRNAGYLIQVQNNGARTPSAAGGFDLNLLQATGMGPEGGGFYWRSPGVKIRNTEVQAGYLSVTADANGAVIDANYSQMTAAAGAITVASSSSEWSQNDIAADQYGNIVQVSASPSPSGTVVGVSAVLARGWQATPPTNPVTFKSRTRGGPFFGSSLTLNLTWTAHNQLKVQPSGGALGFYGATPVAKQTGVAVTVAAVHAALTALGLIAP